MNFHGLNTFIGSIEINHQSESDRMVNLSQNVFFDKGMGVKRIWCPWDRYMVN